MNAKQQWFLCHCNHAYESTYEFIKHKKSVHPEDVEILEPCYRNKWTRTIQTKSDVDVIALTMTDTVTNTGTAVKIGSIPKTNGQKIEDDWKLKPGTQVTVALERLNESFVSQGKLSEKSSKTKRILTENVDAQIWKSETNEPNDETKSRVSGEKTIPEVDGVSVLSKDVYDFDDEDSAILFSKSSESSNQLKMHKCRLCPSWFSMRSSLMEHHEEDHPDTPFRKALDCDNCGESFFTWESLNSHLVKHESLGCPQCDESFTTKRALLGHVVGKHKRQKKFKGLQNRTQNIEVD